MAHALVTGSNRGIGLEICRQLSARGDQVTATCRRSSTDLDALNLTVRTEVDVTSDESIAALERELNDDLDLLVLNAGILRRQHLDDLDFDGIREQFEVNALGPLRVAAALRHRIRPGGKIAIVTSRMGSIEDNTSSSSYGYRMSKTVVNMAGKSLALDLAPHGISVAILHPGYVRTDMTAHNGFIDPPESAAGLIARMDGLSMENSGTFWHANGEVLPW